MGKRIESQRRGKGSPTFKATQKRSKSSYPSRKSPENKKIKAEIIDIFKDPARQTAIQEILLETGEKALLIAHEGAYTGQTIEIGGLTNLSTGSIAPLKEIPEGCPVFNIELKPGDGGKIAKASGKYAIVTSKKTKTVTIKLPSGKTKSLNPECYATIGLASGGERTNKPMIKAGKKFHLAKSKKLFWPKVRGVKRNALDHPFGGSQHHAGKSKSTSRHAPPGRKVGHISSRRTGRKKR